MTDPQNLSPKEGVPLATNPPLTLSLQEIFTTVQQTYMENIEKELRKWHRKTQQAKSLSETLDCQKQVRHLKSLRSHMRQGLFELEDQALQLKGPFTSMEHAVTAILELLEAHRLQHKHA